VCVCVCVCVCVYSQRKVYVWDRNGRLYDEVHLPSPEEAVVKKVRGLMLCPSCAPFVRCDVLCAVWRPDRVRLLNPLSELNERLVASITHMFVTWLSMCTTGLGIP
jgi:hypothetical protein